MYVLVNLSDAAERHNGLVRIAILILCDEPQVI